MIERLRRIVGSELFIVLVLAAFGLVLAASVEDHAYPDPSESSFPVVPMAARAEVVSARVREVFQQAARLPAEARPEFLARALADPTLDPADAARIRRASVWLVRIPVSQ